MINSYTSTAVEEGAAFLHVPFQASNALVPEHVTPWNVPNTNVPLSDPDAVAKFPFTELDVDLADSIKPYLWIAGLYFEHIRPLHRNIVIQREIVSCEQAGLHLVSRDNVIFVKPIPHCLLQHTFYQNYVAGGKIHPKISRRAPAFLATYLRLIKHQSDFSIAIHLGLLPSCVTWEQWLTFRTDLETALSNSQGRIMEFDGRYSHGELRLNRLNLIMRFCKGVTRGYIFLDKQYSAYFAPLFSILVLFTAAYISVTLSAFQVALASPLATRGLMHAGFWFSVITILLLIVMLGLPVIWFAVT